MDNPPIATELLQSGSDLSDRTITLVLGMGDGTATRVDLKLSIVGPLLAAINAEAFKLNAQLPEEERNDSTSLNANAVWLTQYEEGKPMLVFELANGSLLPLAVASGDMSALAQEMALLTSNTTNVQ